MFDTFVSKVLGSMILCFLLFVLVLILCVCVACLNCSHSLLWNSIIAIPFLTFILVLDFGF